MTWGAQAFRFLFRTAARATGAAPGHLPGAQPLSPRGSAGACAPARLRTCAPTRPRACAPCAPTRVRRACTPGRGPPRPRPGPHGPVSYQSLACIRSSFGRPQGRQRVARSSLGRRWKHSHASSPRAASKRMFLIFQS